MARIAALQGALSPSATAPSTAEGVSSSFATTLAQQAGGPLTAAAALPTGGETSAGLRTLQLAQGEVGVTEQPPGSNDSPRIAAYRQSTAGSGVGPWCAYFVSWAAQQAGAPLGEAGQGFGAVSSVWDWAQRTGRAIPASSGPPSPGDLVVWNGTHVGIVESVDGDGKIHTIEGNSSNMVTRRVHDATGDGATGYVRLG